MEQYKKIKDYPIYKISNYGRVRNIASGRVLIPKLGSHRYLNVNLRHNNKAKSFLVHQLVCEAFELENPKRYKTITHIDGNNENNHIDNLMYGRKQRTKVYEIKNDSLEISFN
jgi:hypothetical protein